MASTPPAAAPTGALPQLPLFYKSLAPLSSQLHPGHGLVPRDNLEFTRDAHAIPVTVDEFMLAQRSYPIVFSVGDGSVPLGLVGLNEGQNLFLDPAGQWKPEAYVPAFIRRYPFMLARLSAETEALSLCFDDQSGFVSAEADDKLFNGAEPSDTAKAVLGFCEEFEKAVSRTRNFMAELAKLDLLIDGEVTIQQPGMEQPAVYRGFRMVAEEKLQNIRGDQARKMVQSGMMGLIYAHLFSLSHIGTLFERTRAAAAPDSLIGSGRRDG